VDDDRKFHYGIWKKDTLGDEERWAYVTEDQLITFIERAVAEGASVSQAFDSLHHEVRALLYKGRCFR
jgi:hypothetical protein